MDGWSLSFVLLLPLTVCWNIEVTLVKTLGSEADVTRLCTNDSEAIVALVVCRISSERIRGECELLYEHTRGFKHGCGSRFKLLTHNQTVFLQLSGLTAEDRGSYTCECSQPAGTYIVHLNITVEEENSNSWTQLSIFLYIVAGPIFVLVTSGLILILYYSNRQRSTSSTSGTSAHDSSSRVHQDDPDSPYTSLQQPTADLYQSVSSVHRHHDVRASSAFNNQDVDQTDTDPDSELYENIGEANTTV